MRDFCLKPPVPEIGRVFWFLFVWSIIIPVVCFGVNINQLVQYCLGDHQYYFGILVACMVAPYIAINILSHFWRGNDYNDRNESMPLCESVFSPVAGFIFLTWDTGRYAWKIARHNEQEHYHDAFLRQADRAHLQLINTFISSGPQLVLKVYRFMNEDWGSSMNGLDAIFAILTAVSLGFSLTSTYLNSKRVRYDKLDICYAGAAMQWLQTVLLVSTRVMALACLFSLNKICGLVACFCIVIGCWVCMYCVKSAQTDIMKTMPREYFYRCPDIRYMSVLLRKCVRHPCQMALYGILRHQFHL